MSRTPAQRGPFGNWLKESREARYPTQAKALEEMRRLAGLAIAPSEYAQWEAGSRTPRPDNPKVRGLIDFFGGDPFAAYSESPADATPAGLSELLSRIDRLLVQNDQLIRLLADRAQLPEPQLPPRPVESGPEARKILTRAAERGGNVGPPAPGRSAALTPIRTDPAES